MKTWNLAGSFFCRRPRWFAVAAVLVVSTLTGAQIQQAAPFSGPVAASVEPEGGLARLTFGSHWNWAGGAAEFADFERWTAAYQSAAGPAAKAALEGKGVELASRRRKALQAMIRSDPREAISAAVPVPVRVALPGSVSALLEERISGRGDLAVMRFEAPPAGTTAQPAVARTVKIAGRYFHAYVYGRRRRQTSKKDISIGGIALDGELALLESPVRVLEEGENPATGGAGSFGSAEGKHGRAVEIGGVNYLLNSLDRVAMVEKRAVRMENRAGAKPGALNLEAIMDDSAAALTEDSASTDPGEASPLTDTTGTKRVLMIRVDFSDLPGAPVDSDSGAEINADSLHQVFYGDVGVNAFYESCSYGLAAFSLEPADVTPVIRLPFTAASCAMGMPTLAEMSDRAEVVCAKSYNLDNYDRKILVFSKLPNLPGGPFGDSLGAGDQPGNRLWINGTLAPHTYKHELGHNYGLFHASLWQTYDSSVANSTDTATAQNTRIEYGNANDIMGTGRTDYGHPDGEFGAWYRSLLGWLPAANIVRVTTSQTYRLYRFDHPQAAANPARPLALAIADPNAGDSPRDYWIGLRGQLPAPTTNAPGAADIGWGYPAPDYSVALNMDLPGTTDGTQSALQVGQAYAVPGLTIQVLTHGGSGLDEYLDIDVQLGTTANSAVGFPASKVLVDEDAGSVPLAVTRRAGISVDKLKVHYHTVDETASAAQYTPVSGKLKWKAGDTTDHTIDVSVLPNSLVLGKKKFRVELEAADDKALIENSMTVKIFAVAASGTNDGKVDPAFQLADPDQVPWSISLLPNRKFLLGNYFGDTSMANQDRIVRYNVDGTIDPSFAAGAGPDGEVSASVVQADGKVIIGGGFTHVGATARLHLARLNTDGSLDNTYDPTAALPQTVNTIALQPDGKMLVGCSSDDHDGETVPVLMRLNTDGSKDESFTPPVFTSDFSGIDTIVLQSDGKAMVGGFFSTASSNGFGLMRLLANGSQDPGFDCGDGASSEVHAIVVQPDGKILVGGDFDQFDDQTHHRLVRLGADGTLDPSFDPSLDLQTSGGAAVYPVVWTLALQGEKKILVGGDFNLVNGQPHADLVRLTAFGNLDPGFVADEAIDRQVYALLVQADGSVLALVEHIFDDGYDGRTVVKILDGP